MDTKTEEKKLSDQNNEKIRKKQMRIDEEERLQNIAKDRNIELLKQAKTSNETKRKREWSHRTKKNNKSVNTDRLPPGF